MMPQFDQETLQRLRDKATVTKARMQGTGGDFARYAPLTGKSAIVQPGDGVDVRLLPKWDFVARRYMKQGGKTVENPKYRREECWFGAWEHWFDNKNGQRQRAWCRKNLGEEEACPLCQAAVALKGGGSEEERKQGKDWDQKEVYLYNVVLRATPFGEDGKPDVRILTAPATVYTKISDICTGAEDDAEQKFALGDVSDPFEGHDLRIIRPASQGDRYDVKAARKPSRLYEKADEAKWAGWYTMLYDLEKDVLDNVPSAEQLEKDLYGEAKGGRQPARGPAAAAPATGFGDGRDEVPPSGEEAPFADFDLPGSEAETPLPPAAQPPRRSAGPGRRR